MKQKTAELEGAHPLLREAIADVIGMTLAGAGYADEDIQALTPQVMMTTSQLDSIHRLAALLPTPK